MDQSNDRDARRLRQRPRSLRRGRVGWDGAAVGLAGTLHVDQASGLPVWMAFETERQKFTAEYYDFNAPVRVTKPAGC